MKYKLILSAATLEKVMLMIKEFYYSPNFPDIKLIAIAKDSYLVNNKLGIIENVRVIFKKGRYRFEQLTFSTYKFKPYGNI